MSSKNATEPGPFRFLRAPWSLAARLTTWYAVSAFIIILSASVLLYLTLERSLDFENDRVLLDRANEVRQLLATLTGPPQEIQSIADSTPQRHHTPVYLRMVDGAGRVRAEYPVNAHMPQLDFPPPISIDDDSVEASIATTSNGDRYRVLSMLAPRPAGVDDGKPYSVQVALALGPQEILLAAYRKRLWVAMSAALILCIAIGYEIARRGIRPIMQVTDIARRIRSTTLDARIESRKMPAELQSLAGEFNEMLDRLQDSFARVSRFSADIAHELRTPVNNLRGVAEVALTKARSREEYHEALSSNIEECVRLTHIIENLLFLARAEDPRHQVARETLDLRHELATVAEFYEASATDAGVTINVNVDGPLAVNLNRTLFQRAVGNLLDNSIKHTPAGGKISVGASRFNGTLQIDVADTGVGIPKEHLPHVFDRLYRVANDRSKNTGGAGLGLAIVKSIAATHGGHVNIESREGGGTRVTIAIPIDDAR
ncbi:MAG: heavy metal sensor histidine kinase [Anaerolineae bacterium]|nr:heavy metal sensor histidine kinase [Phycisphaerae bacterium]